MSDDVRLEYLAGCPEALPAVVAWLHAEWWMPAGFSLEWARDTVRGRMHRHLIPLSLVALAGAEPVGVVSLIEEDAPGAAGRVVCLAGLYVPPAWRGGGIGARLCRRAALEARRLGLAVLHLYTPDRQAYYARLGWRAVAEAALEVAGASRPFTFMELLTS
jgi:predicted N-acetyltransferase YhbS